MAQTSTSHTPQTPFLFRYTGLCIIVICLITGLIAAVALSGWILENQALKSVIPGWVAMKANAVIAILLCSVALGLSAPSTPQKARWFQPAAVAISYLVMIFAVLTLAEDFFRLDLWIDEALFKDTATTIRTTQPGRMAPGAAISFLMEAIGILLVNRKSIGRSRFRMPLLKGLAITLIFSGLLTILGCLSHFGTPSSSLSGSRFTGIVIIVGVCVLLQGGGLLLLAWRENRFTWHIDYPATCGMIGGLLLIVMVTHTISSLITGLRQNESQLIMGYKVLGRIRALGREMATIENSTRGYLLTKEDSYLDERDGIINSTRKSISEIRILIWDDPAQLKFLDELEQILSESLIQQDQLISSRKNSASTGLELTKIDTLSSVQRLDTVLRRMETVEYGKSSLNNSEASEAATRVFLILPIASIFSAGLLFSIMFSLNSSMGEEREKENELRKSLKEAKDLKDALDEHAIVSITDAEGNIIFANEKFCQISQYPLEELLGKNHSITNSSHHSDEFVSEIWIALKAGRIWKGEIRNCARDGSHYWVSATVVPIAGDDGQPHHYIAIRTDITAIKRMDEQLKQERALLRAIIDTIPDLIFIKDTRSFYLGCNKAFAEYIDTPEQDLIGRSSLDVLSEEQTEFHHSIDQQLFASREQQRNEEWIPGKNGGGGFFETVKTPYFSTTGECLGLVGISRDVTERRETEEKMRILLERIRIATKAAQVGIWELDLAKDEAMWDQHMYEIYGQTPPHQLKGRARWFEVMQPDDVARCSAVWDEAISQKKDAFDMEYHITRVDNGATVPIRSMGIIQRDAHGVAIRMVGTNRDISEERRREQELAQTLTHERELTEKARAGERTKSEFLAVMSHELRTPMNGIIGFADLLADSPSLNDECRSYAKTIQYSSEALLRILDDILEFSRMEAGHITVETKPFAPRNMVMDIHRLLSTRALEKNISLEVAIDESVPETLEGDAGRIRQILLNLIGNAIKFTNHGWVTVHVGKAASIKDGSDHYSFTITDTGSGIARDKIEMIFQPFTQADSSISRNHGGTGLGLTITRRLTELMGGTITASSEVGIGSEFRITLPLKQPLPVHGQNSSSLAETFGSHFAIQHPLRILLVEDDKVNLKLIQSLVRKLGYTPLSARNGREAVELYRIQRPDCILMDLQMPEMDGLEATQNIRTFERESGLPHRVFICALTANIFPAHRQYCLDAGMDSFMNKPFKPAALAEVLLEASQKGTLPSDPT